MFLDKLLSKQAVFHIEAKYPAFILNNSDFNCQKLSKVGALLSLIIGKYVSQIPRSSSSTHFKSKIIGIKINTSESQHSSFS